MFSVVFSLQAGQVLASLPQDTAGRDPNFGWVPLVPDTHLLTNGGLHYYMPSFALRFRSKTLNTSRTPG